MALDDNGRKELYRKLLNDPATSAGTKKYSFTQWEQKLAESPNALAKIGAYAISKKWASDLEDFSNRYGAGAKPYTPPAAPKPKAAPVAPPPVEEEEAFVEPPVGIAAPVPQKPQTFTDIAREEIAKVPKTRPVSKPIEPISMEPQGFFEGLGTQFQRGIAQGKAIQSVNMGQLRDAAQGKNLDAIPYEQIAEANRAVKQFGQTQTEVDLAKKEGLIKDAWDVVKALPGVTIESLASLGRSGLEEALVGAGMGAAAGSVVPVIGTAVGGGLGATSGMVQAGRNMEYFGTLMQELEANGVDITDAKQLREGIAKYGKNADKTAITRANTIAAVETALPIVGKVAGTAAGRVGSKVVQKPLQAVSKALTYEPVAGPLGGATGELAAQIASGQEIDPQAIALEAGGEGAATVAAVAKAIKGEKKTTDKVLSKIQQRNKIAQAMEEAVKANPEAEGQIRQQYQKRINEAAPTDEEVLSAYESLSVLPETEEKNAIRENLEAYMAEKGIQAEPTGMDAGLGELMRREPSVIQTVNAEFPAPVAEVAVTEEFTPLEEDEDLAAFGRELEAIEQAAPVAPAEEAPAIAPLNIDFAKNEGRNVNYQGIQGRIKIDSDGAPYVFTKDGDVVYIEGGLSGQTPQQLGVQPLADDVINEADVEAVLQDDNAPLDQNQLEYDFDNNTVTLYGKPFTYEGVETNSKGQTTALRLRDANGKVKFVRNEDTILEFEIQKELYEKSRTNKPITVESATAAADQLQVVPVARIEQVPQQVQQERPVGDIEGDEVVSAAPVEEAAPEAPAAPAPKGRKKKEAPVTPAPVTPKKEEGISDVKVSEGKGGWRKSFNETQDIARKNSILEEIADSSTNPNELRDVYEAAKQTEKETNRINYAIANNKNTPQDVFDDLINSKALERTTSDEAIQSIIDKRADTKPAETKEGKKAEAKEERKVTTKVEEYEGVFNPNKTGVAGIDELLTDDGYQFFYKGKKVERVLMSPDEYLERVRKGLKTKTDANILEGKTEAIKKAIESGAKINAPFISTVGGKFSQEGRNRAVVAKELGEQKIPVFIESDVTFDDKINRGAELVKQSQDKGNKTKEEVLEDIKKSGLHRDGVRFIEENYDAIQEQIGGKPEAAPSFTSSQSSEAATAFDKAKTSKGFDKKYGKGAYKALSDITKNFEDIMDKVSEKIKQDCII